MLECGYRGGGANPVSRDLLWFGLYTGMRRGEIMALRWERVDLAAGLFRVAETKTGVPLELPVTRQLGAILARRRADGESMGTGWVFPSPWGRTCRRRRHTRPQGDVRRRVTCPVHGQLRAVGTSTEVRDRRWK